MRRHWRAGRCSFVVHSRAFAIANAAVLALAASRDAVSRLVRHRGSNGAWTGPHPSSRFKQLPRRDWTVLVRCNHFSSHASPSRILRFHSARVDDVMVSYAVPGGGVGHVDS